MKHILKPIAILLIRYLQWRYKWISLNCFGKQTNRTLAKLQLIQAILYYFKSQFHAWGYFHPDCTWSEKDERFYNKLFPQKNFKEVDIVVWYNPEAVTYYHNKIFKLTKGRTPIYELEIKKQLIEWNNWN